MALSLDDATQNWSQLAEIMEGFLESWEAHPDSPPSIADFLPDHSNPVRSLALVELIKVDLDRRMEHKPFHALEWYWACFPELLHDGRPPDDLIYEEFHIRKAAGEQVHPGDYFERFPQNREALERLLQCYDIHHTTSLSEKKARIDFQPGDVVDDFELLTKIGEGAFANVFLARQKSMQRLVALKVTSDRGNEPQTLAQLEHQHIVRVYDQRHLPERKLRLLYMQFAPGGTLHEVVQRVRHVPPAERSGKLLLDVVGESLDRSGFPLPESASLRKRLSTASWPETVCRIGVQLAQALDFAHRKGVLHRDVKPANVLLTAECTPKLADFNISFASQLDGASPAAYFGGSLAYMSPEQLEACNTHHPRSPESLDGRADLYSLAAMLWEMLHGQRPFREEGLSSSWAESLEVMTNRRRHDRPRTPADAPRDELLRQVTEILATCLAPDVTSRPASGDELAGQLALCLQPRSKRLLERPTGGLRRRVRRWPMLAAVLVVLVPNALAGAFNYIYNFAWMDKALPPNFFVVLSAVLNVVYFSFGALLAHWIIGPVAFLVRATLDAPRLDPHQIALQKVRAVRLGHIAAVSGIVLWLTSGIVFPASIHLLSGHSSDGWLMIYAHFFASMSICGLIAAAYPFFGMTFLVTHVYYPALLAVDPGDEEEAARLTNLLRHCSFYLWIAGAVPLVGSLMIVLWGDSLQAEKTVAFWAQVVLVVAGMAGSMLTTFVLFPRIRDDISALVGAIRPLSMNHSGTESVDVP